MNNTTFTTRITEILYNESDAGESFSAISLNPTFAWVKFILTDDQPNQNKQRIPKEEFSNLIKTGIHTPIKMGFDGIKEDHSDAIPLGVITHLKEVDNRIEGIAALWSKEREEDIKMLREMYSTGNLPQLSWEILYQDSKVDDSGVEDLLGDSLRAATIVSMPAYTGRTPIFAMASKQKNSNSEVQNVEELEQLKAKITELETSLSALQAELETKKGEATTMSTELSELRQFKAKVEEEKAAVEKFEAIKNKFKEANIEKDETYFSENKAKLLALDEGTLDFLIQEMVSFSTSRTSQSSTKTKIPNLTGEDTGIETDPKKLAEELKKRLIKK